MDKRFKRYLLLMLGAGVISFLVGTMGVIPVLDKRYNVGSLSNSKNVGEEIIIPEPYIYTNFTPPPDSFGMSEFTFKDVNWTFFWSFFENNTNWLLEYSKQGNTGWEDVTSSDMDIGILRYDNYEKLILNFTCSATGFYRLNFTINQSCSSYWFDGISEYGLNVSIPNSDEVYQVFFNWSDVIRSSWNEFIDYDTGLVGDKFYWQTTVTKRLNKNDHISIDPSFGDSYESGAVTSIQDSIRGVGVTGGLHPAVDGQAYQITAKIYNWFPGWLVKYGLYVYNTDNSNWDFLATTAQHTEGGSNGWHTFALTSYTNVYADKDYRIVAYADDSLKIYYLFGGPSRICSEAATYPTWETPIVWDSDNDNYHVAIYCDYYNGIPWSNTPPTIEASYPVNGSSSIPVSPICVAYINDTDGNSTTCDWYTSPDGSSWTHRQTNSSVTANTTISYVYSDASSGLTDYYWKVTANDGTDNVSSWFNFTVLVPAEQPVLWFNYSYSNVSQNTPGLWFNFSYSNISQNIPTLWFNFSYSHIAVNQPGLWFNYSYSNASSFQPSLWFNYSYSNISQNILVLWFNYSYSNISSFQQGLWFNYSYSNIAQFHPILDFTYSYSNTSQYIPSLWFNYSYSNVSQNTPGLWFNYSYRNVVSFNPVLWFNYSYSNVSQNIPILWFNYSYSNVSQNIPILWFNFSYSNIAQFHNIIDMAFSYSYSNTSLFNPNLWFNYSYSNTSTFNPIMWFNYSYSNIASNKPGLYFTYSYSNTSTFNPTLWFDYSYSNLTSYHSILWFNYSYAYYNSTKTGFTFTYSYSNTSLTNILITNIYPTNNSYNINTQPTMYATITDIKGYIMNISWYYGNNLSTCTNLLSNTTGYDDTYTQLNYIASDYFTNYYWRLSVDDGDSYENITYTFRTESKRTPIDQPSFNAISFIGIIALLGGLIGVIAFMKRRRRR